LARQGDKPTPEYGGYAFCFLLLTFWGAAAVCIHTARWLFRPGSKAIRADADAAPEPAPDHMVRQCLAVPRDALPQGHVRDVLPEYCVPLLARSAAAPGQDAGDVPSSTAPSSTAPSSTNDRNLRGTP
jgi:hypothetical protein